QLVSCLLYLNIEQSRRSETMKTKYALLAAIASLGCGNGINPMPNDAGAPPEQVKIEAPTDLVVTEKNDINVVELSWVSHSSRPVNGWVNIGTSWSSGTQIEYRPSAERFTNGDTLYNQFDVTTIRTIALRIKECLPSDDTVCSEYLEAVLIATQPLDLRAPTDVVVTGHPSPSDSAYRTIEVTWTDNSYGERMAEIQVCIRPNLNFTIADAIFDARGQPSGIIEDLPPNTTIWIFVRVFANSGIANVFSYSGWSEPVEFTTAP
ncbi:MAG: hypothetical protein AAB467_02530, partial [Patescibacteria group bacterium]